MCCGKKRQQLRASSSPLRTARGSQPLNRSAASGPTSSAPETAPASSVYFEYFGKTGLTIVSPVTGRRYRFDRPGDQLAVDARDHSLLLYVPNLKPVRVARNQ
jgi:hypothetical protein